MLIHRQDERVLFAGVDDNDGPRVTLHELYILVLLHDAFGDTRHSVAERMVSGHDAALRCFQVLQEAQAAAAAALHVP